jgi:hypothetical protein
MAETTNWIEIGRVMGDTGPKGDTGDTGPAGISTIIKGSYDSLEELEENVPNPQVGDAYLINGELYVWEE